MPHFRCRCCRSDGRWQPRPHRVQSDPAAVAEESAEPRSMRVWQARCTIKRAVGWLPRSKGRWPWSLMAERPRPSASTSPVSSNVDAASITAADRASGILHAHRITGLVPLIRIPAWPVPTKAETRRGAPPHAQPDRRSSCQQPYPYRRPARAGGTSRQRALAPPEQPRVPGEDPRSTDQLHRGMQRRSSSSRV